MLLLQSYLLALLQSYLLAVLLAVHLLAVLPASLVAVFLDAQPVGIAAAQIVHCLRVAEVR